MPYMQKMRTTSPAGIAASRALNVPALRDVPAIFVDPAAQAVQELLDRLAPSDATLLIGGETGTGKEMAARYVHARSRRRSGPFLAVNCGALSDTLAEAELFGHEKGAFTGALNVQRGWFEAASGGTLLLDEIGDLPLPLQVKLLRVLQEREVVRLGSRTPIPVNVRVIAATNVDLQQAVEAKKFREDLYFRLNVASVTLPPLRARRESLPVFVDHFLRLYRGRLGRPDLEIGAEALAALARHAWPGNIRELENTIHNAVLLAKGPVIECGDLRISTVERSGDMPPSSSLEEALVPVFERALRNKETGIFDRVTGSLVQSAFGMADGNQVRAAAYLGISRNSLRTQLANLGAIAPRRRGPGENRKPRLKEIRIGYQKFGTLNILKALGTLEETLAAYEIGVRWDGFSSGPSLLAALSGGEIDFGSTGEVPPVFAQATGVPVLYVAHEPAVPQGVALVVPDDSNIHDVGDLRGKRLKFSKGSNVHYLVVRALEAHGLSLGDVSAVYAEPKDPLRYVDSDEADGWAFWDPLLPLAQRTRQLRVLLDGTGLVFNHQFYVASEGFAGAHGSLLPILLEQLHHAGLYVANRPAEAASGLAAQIGVEAQALQVAFTRLTHGPRPLSREVIWEQQKIADRFYALGLLPRAVSIRDAVLPAPAAARPLL